MYTFGADDVLAAIGVTAADFEIKDVTPKTSKKHAVARTRLNAYVAGSVIQFDEQTEYQVTLEAKTPAGAAATFNLGGPGGGTGSNIVITAAKASMKSDGLATLTVTCHIHTTTTTHEATPAATPITTPVLGFGIVAHPAISGALPDELQTAEWGVECDHKDYTTRLGVHLTGVTSGVKYSWAIEMLETGTLPTLTAGYKAEEVSTPSNNDGLRMLRMSGFFYA
jgi:hypothetical protein